MEKQDGNSMDELLQMVRMGLKACPLDRLPEGNSSEHPFSLSIHGAWMLQKGIEKYAQDAPSRSADVNDCLVRYETAIREATKLRDWCAEVDANYLKFNIDTLDSLLKEMESEIGRLQDAQG
jgi:hypothetical protein